MIAMRSMACGLNKLDPVDLYGEMQNLKPLTRHLRSSAAALQLPGCAAQNAARRVPLQRVWLGTANDEDHEQYDLPQISGKQ